jgi:hypothetical protein
VDDVVYANPPLLEVTGVFTWRVVVFDLRIGKMFVRRIAEASVDGNGKGLVDNGGISGCWWSEREMGKGGGRGRSKGLDEEGKG